MEYIGQHNDRGIYYSVANGVDWESGLLCKNWLLFVIGDMPNKENIIAFVKKSISLQPSYICAAGKACELIHDLFDEEIVWQDVMYSSSYAPMTTWHNDLKEGIWFAVNEAYVESLVVDKVICVDLNNENDLYKQQLLLMLN
jgi:hypothetical protein